jgi:peptide/nickel transport system substrate-binding protein
MARHRSVRRSEPVIMRPSSTGGDPIAVHCLMAVAVSAVGLLLGACGGGSGGSDDGQDRSGSLPAHAKVGGTLKVLFQGDVDSIDPGITYFTAGFFVTNATQRPLMGYRPDEPGRAVPDLAAAVPRVSPDGRTVSARIRRGVRFSPPVGREVTSGDVKYAIERAFFNTVNNGYVGTYFGDVVGAQVGAEPGRAIRGIRTPDERTIVFRLVRPTGGSLVGALALAVTAPVPREYAFEYDRRMPSAYGQHQVATGPYMIANDASGAATGYESGRRIRLVRNPSWVSSTSYKPAYLDEIVIAQGNEPAVAARQVLVGSHVVSGDFPVPPEVSARISDDARDQVAFVSTGGVGFLPLNTAIEPFDDLNVRRAVVAGFDRYALRQVIGGRAAGALATHFIPPGTPGFEEAGGTAGPAVDFVSEPRGDAGLAARYLRRAGFASGRFEGREPILIVGPSDQLGQRYTTVVQRQFELLGFETRVRLLTGDAMLTKFCMVPRAGVHACAAVAKLRDFADARTILDPLFNGGAIRPQGNTNMSQLSVPAIDAAIARAKTLSDAEQQASAWAEVDRLVTAQAPAVPVVWGRQTLVRSDDVAGVASRYHGMWDLTYTSLR